MNVNTNFGFSIPFNSQVRSPHGQDSYSLVVTYYYGCLTFWCELTVSMLDGIVQQGNVAEALRLTEEYLSLGNWILNILSWE